MLQACLRVSRGIPEPPDTEWRCYSDYDAFPGENASVDSFAEVYSEGDGGTCGDTILEQAVEAAKLKCIESGYGGFAILNKSIYFRKHRSFELHFNLRPAKGVVFYVAPQIDGDTLEADTKKQSGEGQAEHHQQKIIELKEAVLTMGLDVLTDRQAVYWLERACYVPETAVMSLLDAPNTFAPADWLPSCACSVCQAAGKA